MELVQGERVDMPNLDRVLITWLAPDQSSESEYNVRDLKERRWVDNAKLILVDDAQGREWFELQGGEISGYEFVRFARPGTVGLEGSSSFELQRVERDANLDRILHYPSR